MRFCITAFLLSMFCLNAVRAEEKEAPAGAKSRKFQFTYTAILDTIPEGAKSVDLWIPIPQDNPHQTITNLTFKSDPAPDIGLEPELNNRIAHWKFNAAQAKGKSVTMIFDCVRKEISAKDLDKARDLTGDEKKLLDKWLQANNLVLVGGDFVKVADAATKGATKPNEIAKAAYDYTITNMKYDKPADKPGWGKGSTQWACDMKFGNCTDFHALVMSIGRTKGVPVKFELGALIPTDKKEGPVPSYHCWAKFYLGGVGWVPVDAAEAATHPTMATYYYGNLTADRVQFTNGRDVNLVPKQAEGPLPFFGIPYGEADGKKIPVSRAFAFKDLDK
ncbi:MAG TPA: transglutaminase-like domain-containing protein [Planctomycetota bacterium]|nr:transglutaminase-like domain-containing protein [Planctomycetota bacterium]